jgi:CelD/BcsL family acetyltransferase involved in cellulose biosynthesis
MAAMSPAALPMVVEWLVGAPAFGAMAAEWDAALSPAASPFDLHAWLSAWWRAFGVGTLTVCVVRREGTIVAALPMCQQGGRLVGLANDHSGLFRPLAVDESALRELSRAVSARRAGQLTLPMLPAEGPALRALAVAAGENGKRVLEEPGPVSPLVATDGDVEDWRRGAKAKWKARLARYRRKMERENNAAFDLLVAPDRLEEWLDEGFRIEASGWKGKAGTAIESDPRTAGFYRDIAARFQERGELRLSRLALDGQVVAFSYCIQHGDRLYSLKTGYDESWRKLVPGLVLQLSIVERCFDLGLASYELLGNTAEWKQKLATGEREHRTLRLYSRGPGGQVRHLYRGRVRPVLARTSHRLRTPRH